MEYIITNNNKNTKMCIYYLISRWNELVQIVMNSGTTQNPIWEIVFWKWIQNGLVKNKEKKFLTLTVAVYMYKHLLGFNHLMKYLEPKFYYEILVQLPTTWNHHYGTWLIWSAVSPNKMNIACHSLRSQKILTRITWRLNILIMRNSSWYHEKFLMKAFSLRMTLGGKGLG